jgi:hypothetical protein
MSITINDALTVTIPNNQILFDERFIATTGFVQSKTDVRQIPIVRIPSGTDFMPRLGGMFFSSAYLMVNHDKGDFTIAPTPTKSAAPKIMAFDTANDCIAPVEAALASGAPSPSSSGSGNSGSSGNSNSSSLNDSSALSGGAIAGIVIGALAGIALIAGIAFILWRRKRLAADRPAESAGVGTAPVEKYAYRDPSEMYVENGHELGHGDADAARGVAHELDGGGDMRR